MRKLKKIVITSDISILTDLEQSSLFGGQSSKPTGCEGKPYDKCSGYCYIGNDRGKCGWTYKDLNRCTCAVAGYGKI